MNPINALMLAAAMAVSSAALAHGDEDHAKKAGPVKKEQKAWGIAGNATAVKRSVEFKMTDQMRFH